MSNPILFSNPRIRPSWDAYFMDIAKVVATRSPDPKKQVGCVIVDSNHRIISTGYNGLVPGFDDSIFYKENDREKLRKYILHAEVNALIYSKCDLSQCTLYTTTSPCTECLKNILSSGIKTVFFLEKYKDFDETDELCKKFGINLFWYQLIQEI
ncbi:MAG TPA: dCMP deaminase family protein [Allocoleopsis sp.]